MTAPDTGNGAKPTRKYRGRVQLFCEGSGRTKQSMQQECDINFIMEKYKRTGQLPPSNQFPGQYGDFSEVLDYQGSQNQVIAAQAAFDELSSEIRTRFDNDPAKLLDFCSSADNIDEARELGLLPAKIVPTTPEVASPPPENGGETPSD